MSTSKNDMEIKGRGMMHNWNWNPSSSMQGKVVGGSRGSSMGGSGSRSQDMSPKKEMAMGVSEMEMYANTPSLQNTIARRRAVENYQMSNRSRSYMSGDSSATKADMYEMEEYMMPSGGKNAQHSTSMRKTLLPDGRTMVTESRTATFMFHKSWIEGEGESGSTETMEVNLEAPEQLQNM